MDPYNRARDDSKGRELVEAHVRIRYYEYYPPALAYRKIAHGTDYRAKVVRGLGATRALWYRVPVRAGRRMAEQCADAVGYFRR